MSNEIRLDRIRVDHTGRRQPWVMYGFAIWDDGPGEIHVDAWEDGAEVPEGDLELLSFALAAEHPGLSDYFEAAIENGDITINGASYDWPRRIADLPRVRVTGPCRHCGREERDEHGFGTHWFSPCPSDDCPSHEELAAKEKEEGDAGER